MSRVILTALLVLSLALGVRLINISKLPLSLNWDEATFGYNAYSLLLTGKDEYGETMPLQFKSIGDYKNPMYIYLLVPSIKTFWLTDAAIRLPPAVLGALSAVVLFILVYTLFANLPLATIAGVVLALSPWHIQFSRGGADVGVSSFFIILGICLFVRKRFVLATTSLVGAIYSYYADKMFAPLVLLTMLFTFRKSHYKITQLVPAFIIGTILLLPVLGLQFSSGHKNKVSITTLLSYRFPTEVIAIQKSQDHPLLYAIFHNPLFEYGSLVLDRYANHFNPSFLFTKGLEDNRQRQEGMGMLYWTDALFLILALVSLTQHKPRRAVVFVLLWLLIAPLPAAITRDSVHARRAINMVYPLSILISLGVWQARKYWWLWTVPVIWAMGLYFISYTSLTPMTTYKGSAGWQYGYKQLVASITPIADKYERIVVDPAYQGPYVYFLLYQQYPPAKYQPQAKLVFSDPTGLGEVPGFDNYEFRSIYWPADRGTPNTLFAGPPEKLPLQDIDPKQAKLLETIYFPDGTEAFRIVETASSK